MIYFYLTIRGLLSGLLLRESQFRGSEGHKSGVEETYLE